MSFPRYPKYKDSGVEWLGKVPEHWEVARAGSLGVFSSSGIDKKLVEGEVPVQMFNYLDVYKSSDKVLRYSGSLMETTAPASKVDEHSVVEGDILLTPSSETRDDIGHAARVAEMPCPVVYSYHLIRLRLQQRQAASYMTYALNAAPVRAYFEAVCTGTTRMVLVRDDLKNAPVALPSPRERAAIASFLDRETAKIDALIAEQQRLIELLQEKRQAVISHAVTKGLNPDAPMKDAGIEWLDEMPKHWITSKPKYLTTKIVDGVHFKPEYVPEGIPFVTVQNLTAGDGISFDNLNYITTEAHEEYYRRANPERGDVLLTKDGATLGVARVIETDLVFSIFVSVALLKPMRDRLDPWFLRYAIESSVVFQQFKAGEQGSALKHIHLIDLRNVILLLPPLEEQREIVRFLNARLGNLDSLVTEAQQAIDLLQERRSALISAAVTGQIDVRGLAGSEAA